MRIGLAIAAMVMLFIAVLPAKTYAENAIEIMPLSVNPGAAENVANSPIFMSVTIANKNDFSQPFVAVFEVRDAEGSTVFVKMEAGMLAPQGQLAPRTFWVPDSAGDYVARAFVISSVSNPEVLSAAQSAAFTVQESSSTPEPSPVFSLKEAPASSLIYQLKLYALEKINSDRIKFGLDEVNLSQNIAAQQHADEILATKVLSYWTAAGEKPYMAYNKYGGLGVVAQNVAMSGSLQYYADCTGGQVCDAVDPFEQIDLHQYGMVYTDAECCDDAHKNRILDPVHTDVSIGIAYDDYTFVMVQNFESNHMKLDQLPAKRANYVELAADIPKGQIKEVNVHYDERPSPAIYEQNKGVATYELGELVGTVVPPGGNSTSGEIVADYWKLNMQSVEIGFSLNSVNERRGVYTVVVIFEDIDGSVFPIMSYSLL